MLLKNFGAKYMMTMGYKPAYRQALGDFWCNVQLI